MNCKILQIRETLGLSQKEFGAKMGLPRIAISSLERGITAVNLPIVDLLCDVYHVNRKWLQGQSVEMFADEKQIP